MCVCVCVCVCVIVCALTYECKRRSRPVLLLLIVTVCYFIVSMAIKVFFGIKKRAWKRCFILNQTDSEMNSQQCNVVGVLSQVNVLTRATY